MGLGLRGITCVSMRASRNVAATGRAPLAVVALAAALACSRDQSPPEPESPAKTAGARPELPGPFAFGEALPGTRGMPAPVVERLERAWLARAEDYAPRTRHLAADGAPHYSNRLLAESSPYLRQHAHNPVNWFPWGAEAFATAKRLGWPVLLSIGYSTCHWCHVMEEESFEDEEVAEYLNRNYVAIKVDREERPDVDAIYMAAVYAIKGDGGWPMTVWLTPERQPFFAGTYLPRDHFVSALTQLREVFDEEPEAVARVTSQVLEGIHRRLSPDAALVNRGVDATSSMLDAANFYARRFDEVNGGLAGSPKFPSSLSTRFLFRYHRRTGDERSLRMATLSLQKMARGGMYDHVAGGFHRYSTDAEWLVPHFEKMLYDNALLATAYLEGYQATGEQELAEVARETLDYVAREMTDPRGGFYSATDADSLTPSGHREEGYHFTWAAGEIDAALSIEDARLIRAYYNVTDAGNFEGRTVLHVTRPLVEVARSVGVEPEAARSALARAKKSLRIARAERPPPLLDNKILTAWNGLMISAFAGASLALGDDSYARRAARAADFLLANLRDSGGRLLRSYAGGRARFSGYLDDYVFFIAGLLDLFEATHEPRWLQHAIALDRVVERHFEDSRGGGCFFTGDDHEELLVRQKPRSDGARPSGNSVQVLNLARLAELTGDTRYLERARLAVGAFEDVLGRAPVAMSELLLALDFLTDSPKQIVIVSPPDGAGTRPFLRALGATFLPNRFLVVTAQGSQQTEVVGLVPVAESKVARRGRATAYVCEKGRCELPTNDAKVFAGQIRKVKPLRVAAGQGG